MNRRTLLQSLAALACAPFAGWGKKEQVIGCDVASGSATEWTKMGFIYDPKAMTVTTFLDGEVVDQHAVPRCPWRMLDLTHEET